MAKYKELVLLRDKTGVTLLSVMPTGIAHTGDIAMVDEAMLTIEQTEWIDIDSPTFEIITQTCDVVTIDSILHVVWEKEEENAA